MKLTRERWASRSGERYTMESGLRRDVQGRPAQRGTYKRCEETRGRLGRRVYVTASKKKRKNTKHEDKALYAQRFRRT